MTPDQIPKYPTLAYEKKLWNNNIFRVAGIDEAGRGALAGPVYAAVVILPPDPAVADSLNQVRDSKLMTALARQKCVPLIRAMAVALGVGSASALEIDTLGIVPATKLAAMRALTSLNPDYLLTDYLILSEVDFPQTALPKGDRLSLSVAAASILAKTSRDTTMFELEDRFPGYGFARHKGYATIFHQQAIKELDLCVAHRRSFRIPGITDAGVR